jgi:hypothetical protein
MIGNGVCDQLCYVEGCYYDRDDCKCGTNCMLNKFSYNYCSDECMDLRCDQHKDLMSCTDITKKKQNYYIQMLTHNFDARFSQQECLNSDPSCSVADLTYDRPSSWNYHGQCHTVKCVYFLPYYNSYINCSDSCSICVNSSTCLECKPTKLQYFTECVDLCPAGYEPISISFLSQQVCMSKIYVEVKDKSTYSNPTKIYVNPSATSEGSGTINNPYKSLSQAFRSISDSFTAIILFEGIYDLDLLNPSGTYPFYTSSSPLKRLNSKGINSSFKYISIQAAFCQDYGEKADCNKSRPIIRPSKLVQIYLNSNLFEITGVDFDGSDLVCNNIKVECPCSVSVCNYCAKVTKYDGTLYTDQFQRLDLLSYDLTMCKVFKSYIFLESIADSKIYLKDVEFRNFRMGQESLIYVANSSLFMYDVNFYNIIPGITQGRAVISISNRDTSYYYFLYEGGKVSLLNDGYELLQDTYLTGFLTTENVYEVSIRRVIFEFNISYIGSSDSGYGSLIYVINPRMKLEISDTVFNNNFVNSRLIYIDLDSIKITTKDYNSGFYTKDNIILENIHISNSSCKKECIRYSTIYNFHNILISGITIKDSVSISQSMMKFFNSKSVRDIDKFGGYSEVGGSYLFIPARRLTIQNVSVENTFFSEEMINLISMANVRFSNFNIVVNKLTLNRFINENYYVRFGYREVFSIQCNQIIRIKSCYAFSWIDGVFSSNNCKRSESNTSVVILESYGDLTISNVKFNDIYSSSINSNAIFILEHDDSLITISNCMFRNITNTMGTGVLRIKESYHVSFYNNTLSDISGSSYGAIYIESSSLDIKGCDFDNIESKNDNGGAIAFHGNDLLNISKISIMDSKFNECKTPKAYGCIAIDRSSLAINLNLVISNLHFTRSVGQSAAIYIEESVSFSEAQIYNITVSESTSLSTGPLYLKHSIGQLKILNSRFFRNIGFNCGIFAELGRSGKLLYLENISIEAGICDVNSIYLLSKVYNTQVELKSLNISGNKGAGLEISKVIITDSYSTYKKNELGVYLTDKAEGYFDIVKIIENKNINTAGGVLMVSESEFTCNNCIISYNQGLEGGGLRSEQDSYFSILNSIFEGNRAMNSDSAIFILSSKRFSTIENTEIIKNISEMNFLISVLNGNLIIKNSAIKENTSILGNPSIMSYASSIVFSDTIFSNQM